MTYLGVPLRALGGDEMAVILKIQIVIFEKSTCDFIFRILKLRDALGNILGTFQLKTLPPHPGIFYFLRAMLFFCILCTHSNKTNLIYPKWRHRGAFGIMNIKALSFSLSSLEVKVVRIGDTCLKFKYHSRENLLLVFRTKALYFCLRCSDLKFWEQQFRLRTTLHHCCVVVLISENNIIT